MGYLKKAYTVCVSTYQMAVLLAYNEADSHSTASLAHATQLPSHELTSTIQSLLDSKILLEVSGEGGMAGTSGVTDEARGGVAGSEEGCVAKEGVSGHEGGRAKRDEKQTTFKLNMNYSNKRTKFKITAMLQKDSQQVSWEWR